MLVRCGRCRIELEVAGAGEFACPNCGARNAVRDPGGMSPGAGMGPAPTDPFGIPDLGAAPPSPPPPPVQDTGVRWVACPSCSYRFAVGEVDEVACPACGIALALAAGGEVRMASE